MVEWAGAKLTELRYGMPDAGGLVIAPNIQMAEYIATLIELVEGDPPGALRIGFAHGSVANFGDGGEAINPIDPARTAKARLDYLALGDWHRTLQIGPAIWYAGTPEPDRAGGQEQGTALLVEIAGPGAAPSVSPLITGTYRWITRSERIDDESALTDLDQRLRNDLDLSRLILRLRIERHLAARRARRLSAAHGRSRGRGVSPRFGSGRSDCAAHAS